MSTKNIWLQNNDKTNATNVKCCISKHVFIVQFLEISKIYANVTTVLGALK